MSVVKVSVRVRVKVAKLLGSNCNPNSNNHNPKCALLCLGPLAPRGAVGARHDGLPHLSTRADCVSWLVSLRRICRSTPRCCKSTSFSACPFFACLRLFPVVSLWLGVRTCHVPIPIQFSPFYSCQEIFVRYYAV